MSGWADREGLPFPLGQSWVKSSRSYNFALYSKNASEVRLLLFHPSDLERPCLERRLDHLSHKTGRVWHARVRQDEAGGARYYGYRVSGPGEGDGNGLHAFDPDKLAVDPYARCVLFPPAFDREAAASPGSNLARAPLGVLLEEEEAPVPHRRSPVRHESDLILYEMHVRGFTRHPSSRVPEARRGTYAGVVDKIPHLKDLGVTAVELMPVFQFDPQEGNYWGYNPLFFFVPHAAYASTPDVVRVRDEFRAMVDALHDAGLEVLLDVVYNHTGEGGNGPSPRYSYKLIDNRTYYILDTETGAYRNYSGTGNSIRSANRAVRELILDSMRYWVREMGIDGFRFDLASVLARKSDGEINLDDPPIFGQISGDPELQGIRLIAEPWDVAAYQLGHCFRGITWWQWNGKFRDAVQRFVRGDPGLAGEMATRLYGSPDLFPDSLAKARRPYQSVNYIVSHDGFTLYDLVSYTRKRNWANGENNEDGTEDYSWNCGVEGDDDLPAEILRLRMQQMKNALCLLMLANGTPMLSMGDEFGSTQGGNNNPYNQDNETAWLDWSRKDRMAEIHRFTREMIAFRKAHPSLCRSRFWREDVTWYGPGREPDWSDTSCSLAFCLHGAVNGDGDIYLMANTGDEDLTFEVQEPGPWERVVDTARPSPEDIHPAGRREALAASRLRLQAHSTVVLEKRRGRRPS